MSKELTIDSFIHAAWMLNCEPAAIRAVAQVESGPLGAFLETGDPVILFERHAFHRLTEGKFDGARVDGGDPVWSLVSSPAPGGYGPNSVQHKRLSKAVQLDRTAAIKSASWGIFQILGDNHAQAGCKRLQDFVNVMYDHDVNQQLRAFVMFVLNDPRLAWAIRDKDWARFAYVYNGPNYGKNLYDTRIAQAYEALK